MGLAAAGAASCTRLQRCYTTLFFSDMLRVLCSLLYMSSAVGASYNVQFYQTSDCTGAPVATTNVPETCTALPGTSAIYGLAISSSTVTTCTEDSETGSGDDNCNSRMAATSQSGLDGCTMTNVGDCSQAPGQNVYLRVNKLSWSKTANKTSGHSLCAGYVEGCTVVQECSKTLIGPCDNGTTSASKYIQSEFTGVAFVDVSSYETCAEPGSGEDPSCEFGDIAPDTGRIYRDIDSVKVSNSISYAYTMTGMGFGNANVGAYAGLASYLNTGLSNIASTTNKLYSWVPGMGAAAVQRGSSNMGAPRGPFEVCISDVVNGKCSNTTRVFPRHACARTEDQTLLSPRAAARAAFRATRLTFTVRFADKFSIYGFSYSAASNTEE